MLIELTPEMLPVVLAKVICPPLPVNERTPLASGKSRVSLTPTSVSRAIPRQSISKLTRIVDVLIELAIMPFVEMVLALIEEAFRLQYDIDCGV